MEFELLKECERLLGEELDEIKIALFRDDSYAITIRKDKSFSRVVIEKGYLDLPLENISKTFLRVMVNDLRHELIEAKLKQATGCINRVNP